jgi:hypothetical protein
MAMSTSYLLFGAIETTVIDITTTVASLIANWAFMSHRKYLLITNHSSGRPMGRIAYRLYNLGHPQHLSYTTIGRR